MAMESAREARGEGCAGAPTGFRRLTPSLLRADRTAAGFDGLPDGVTVPGQLLAAFKAAAPRLGLSPRLVHAVDWLFRFTQPQDWGRGGRPIVWPSASMQQEALGLSIPCTTSVNLPCQDAGRRICGCATGDRSTTRWILTSLCCGSIHGSRLSVSSPRQPTVTCRWRCSTWMQMRLLHSIRANCFSHVPICTWHGEATGQSDGTDRPRAWRVCQGIRPAPRTAPPARYGHRRGWRRRIDHVEDSHP
jgi:Replication protein C N-terminal domain